MKQSHYDYLVVGAGISSAVFVHEAAKLGKSCLILIVATISRVTFTRKRLRVSMCIVMARISSIPRFVPFGIM